MEFYPAGLRALSLLAIKKAFDADDEQIRKYVPEVLNKKMYYVALCGRDNGIRNGETI